MSKNHVSELPTGFNTSVVELTTHAFERMQERFPEQSKNKNSATAHVRSLLKNSKYIGIVADKTMCNSHMFVFNSSIAIHVDINDFSVRTIFPIERNTSFAPFQQEIERLYQKEFRKVSREEKAFVRKMSLLVAQNEATIAQLKLRKVRSRSENVQKTCSEEIRKLQEEIWAMNTDFKNLQIRKRDLAYVIAKQAY